MLDSRTVVKQETIQEFCDRAESVDFVDGIWFVDRQQQVATFVTSLNWSSGDWDAVYAPSSREYKLFQRYDRGDY